MNYMNTITSASYTYIGNSIVTIFTLAHFGRFVLSENKSRFFKNSIWYLLAIFPVNLVFSFFRNARIASIARAVRVMKVLRLTRPVGLSGKLQKNTKIF
ncbi:hypothetical protein FC19_GL001654 [Liquorilactobacillus aquaticus DSM 21051]|uniref:Uncharacterized protein n=1 Tax=Liquorilactobacillus aquaticus DSM 21051 TaxID=1423725 RepID=A0A0R2D0W7_9LACO|nr:hypothetical protein [Liquorilactobacillus aquaticus]KRM97607.1 hypothetical protein FC19_GL001654 [Liquorilactobacillus aquaticus DSM 21051]